MTFRNIAHYNREGFYDTWLTRDRHRLGFVQKLLRWPCHGDTKFTFSDVEYAIQRIMRERNYLGRFELGAAEELRAAEMKDLERLEAKYRKPQQVPAPAEELAPSPVAASEPASVPHHRSRSDQSLLTASKGAFMGYPVYYDGELEIVPPLTEEHAAIVRDFAKGDRTDLAEPIFAAIATSDEPDLPYSCGLFEVAEDRSWSHP